MDGGGIRLVDYDPNVQNDTFKLCARRGYRPWHGHRRLHDMHELQEDFAVATARPDAAAGGDTDAAEGDSDAEAEPQPMQESPPQRGGGRGSMRFAGAGGGGPWALQVRFPHL